MCIITANTTKTTNIFTQNVTTSFAQTKVTQELTFGTVLPTVSGSTPIPATSLPDPSTFFDTIGPEPQLGSSKSTIAVPPALITEAIDGLSIKVREVYQVSI